MYFSRLILLFFLSTWSTATAFGQAPGVDRFSSYVKWVEKNPASRVSVENVLIGLTKEPGDLVELRRVILDEMQHEASNSDLQSLLSWTYMQQKNFHASYLQEVALDKRLGEDGSRLMELGQLAVDNQAYNDGIASYRYVVAKGKTNQYYEMARKMILNAEARKLELMTPAARAKELSAVIRDFELFLKDFPRGNGTPEVMYGLARLEARYLDSFDRALDLLEKTLALPQTSDALHAQCKLEMGDISMVSGKIWDAALYYGQVAKSFGEEPVGQEARFRSARIYYYTGDFFLAKSQLDVLKTATSELVANDALKLGLLIQENTVDDSVAPALKMFARSELLLYRHKGNQALKVLDSIRSKYPGNSLEPEVLMAEAKVHLLDGQAGISAKILQSVITKYPRSIRADDAIFQLAGLRETALNDKAGASTLYTDLLLKYPGSFYVPESRKRIRILRGEKADI